MKHALLVGVGAYVHEGLARLDSPTSDVREWAKILGDPELGAFDRVTLSVDDDSRALQDQMYDFLAAAAPDDFLLLYYSGHGRLQEGRRLYLTATGTDPERLPPTAVPAEELRHWVDECRAGELVLILDCCHAGAFADLKQRGDRSRIVVVSAGATENAHEGDGYKEHALPSAFSGPFLEGLRTGAADSDGNGIISVREAFEYAAVRMVDKERAQTPQMRAAGVGDLILSNAPRRETIPRDLLLLTRSALPSARALAVEELGAWMRTGLRTRAQLTAVLETLEDLARDSNERVSARARQTLLGGLPVAAPIPADEPVRDASWVAGSTLYEVEVRTFYDTYGDGVGDLHGVSEKLDYLQRLGVDCLVLAPIMRSPWLGGDHDPAALTSFDSGLGQPSHLLELVGLAHRRGMRVVLDLPVDGDPVREAMDFWLGQGVDGLRLLGVRQSERLAEVRAWLDDAYPGRVLIGSCLDEAESCFGTGGAPGCHLVMYPSLMPSLLLAMRRGAHRPVSTLLSRMRSRPWAVFLRNGDEMRLDGLASAERDELVRTHAPLVRMLNESGIRRRMAGLLDDDRGSLELAYALLLSMPGVPILYYGDEIGMGENLSLPGTMAVRTPMQWAPDRNGGFSTAPAENLQAPVIHESAFGYMAVNVENQLRARSSLLHAVTRLIAARRACQAFTGPEFRIVRSTNPAVLAFVRGTPGEQALCVFNFAPATQTTTLTVPGLAGTAPRELMGGAEFSRVPPSGEYDVGIVGHGFFWFGTGSAG